MKINILAVELGIFHYILVRKRRFKKKFSDPLDAFFCFFKNNFKTMSLLQKTSAETGKRSPTKKKQHPFRTLSNHGKKGYSGVQGAGREKLTRVTLEKSVSSPKCRSFLSKNEFIV